MGKLLSQLNKEERGTTIIEFAFVLTIMLAMTFAMIDFGRYVYTHNTLQSAAQEGARAGIANLDAKSAAMSKLIALDATQATVNAGVNSLGQGAIIQVDVTYQFQFITPILSAVAGGPIEVVGSASMMKE